ncbi:MULTISPECIES: hypothetical protein [Serratia]|uniref:hypothetical protein n=1 Tax=Serratia TaxID=613 RepID=UPI000E0F1BE7|nr:MULTISPECIES: hypothetical protein [Serratia]MBP0996069.1 hypothetical protein [Serratia fonticola]MBP1003342.1 hypothetical protein [Serratia fonticola]MBP1012953.1 hypothetical protein [Serratia fonticola]MBP1015665.1 hypothetical protein [Serratia fonticola]MBP1034667.1 hypothetical protein [Serratia fonticola]
MQQKPVLHEARQLKRLNAATRRQSHMYKWIALVAALDALLVFYYDRDMRNVSFSTLVALVCGYLWIRDRNKARGYRREYDDKYGNSRHE